MQNLRLLIIEDDIDQRQLMGEMLEDHFGAGVVSGAGTGRDALKLDLSNFDLILADYNLPDCNGLELLESLQAVCRTPIIMVTGENVGHIAAQSINKGATDYIVKSGDYLQTIALVVEKNLIVARIKRENDLLRQELEAALFEVRSKNTQLESSLQLLEEMAATDPLTKLHNRRYFSQVIDQLFAEADRYDKDLSCVMIDLDGYKQLNDGYGHQVGDQLLQMAGKAISANMRKMDVAARYGGDEFVLLLPVADTEQATAVAQRISSEFAQSTARFLNRSSGVTMSIGISSMRAIRPAHADELIASADAALYTAKERGRNCISHAETLTTCMARP